MYAGVARHQLLAHSNVQLPGTDCTHTSKREQSKKYIQFA